MVRAWYMDDDSSVDKRKPHQTDPIKAVTVEDLKKLGIFYYEIKDWENNEELKSIRKDRDYNYEDSITCTKEGMPDLEEKLVIFFTEHIHIDEEIRLITDGSGYFDVRDNNDKWIRINVVKNDMIILPAGVYHRFTLDEKNYIKANRYFTGVPVWTPFNRPAEDQPSRKAYLEFLAKA